MCKLFLFFICVMVSSVLHGMDEPLSDKVTLEIIITNRLAHGDYDTYRTVAQLSKARNQFIENNYRPTKKRIESSGSLPNDKKDSIVSWNRDFSACTLVDIVLDESFYACFDKKRLYLSLWSLKDNKVMHAYGAWDQFKFSIFEDNVRPFFNKEGRACFYGYGNIKTGMRCEGYSDPEDPFRMRDIFEEGFWEYSIDSDGNKKCCLCLHDLKILNNFRSCQTIMNFPVLLQALLQSKSVEKSTRDGMNINTYHVNGVCFPENYKDFKQHVAWQQSKMKYGGNQYKSYEALPDEFRQAIDQRYLEQQQEKKIQEK